MSRFFKSAAFPILIVVVLAFFAQKLISPGPSGSSKPQFGDFQSQLAGNAISEVDVKTKDNTIQVTPRHGSKYEIGYPDQYATTLIKDLNDAKAAHRLDNYDVEGKKSNGWLSLLTYILPFLIFIGFWIFLMNQVQG
ncbi:MAG: cell division protease FtsH, partial [Solirubrobacteraceae bacterium]|nr:cell division protease FtsH [Solirubrobacteraceae bacterium]